jgi:hypothetical protein
MRHRAPYLAVLALMLGVCTSASAQDPVWTEPVLLAGPDLVDNDSILAPLGRVVAVQQRTYGAPRIMVSEIDGRTGTRGDSTLVSDGWGAYPRIALAPTGRMAVAFNDDYDVHVYVKDPTTAWHEVGTLPQGHAGYAESRPFLAFSDLGHLVVAWPRVDSAGGQRVWLAELPPGSDTLTEPRPLDPPADPPVVQVTRDLAVGPGGRVAVGYLEGADSTSDKTSRVAFGRLGEALDDRPDLAGITGPSSGNVPQVDFDAAGRAAIAWQTVPDGFASSAPLGDLHLAIRRADGTIAVRADVGRGLVVGQIALAVSDPGELLFGFQAANNLSMGDDGSAGYSLQGYQGILGSTALERLGTPRVLTQWSSDSPRLGMNRRGDAVLAYTECCPNGRGVLHVRRRVPGSPFGAPVVAAAGDLVPASSDGWYYGPWPEDVALDEIGNAMVAWRGFGPDPSGLSAALSPLLETPLPAVPLGDVLPEIVREPLETFPYPGGPITSYPSLPATDAARVRVVRDRLAMSATPVPVHGVPRKLRFYVACDRPCQVKGSGRVAGLRVRAAARKLAAGRTARMTVRLSASTRKRVRARLRHRRAVNLRLTLVGTSTAGTQARSRVVVPLRRH